ncbi:MAG: tRNA lysidine(34) synthetase TilS [Nitrospirota bacterium]
MSTHDPLLAAVSAVLREVGACPADASPAQTVLVAVSGGPDSVCLLDALSRLFSGRASRRGRFTGLIHVAHLHHGLRGRDADQDEAFVRETARRYGWPITAGRIDVRVRAKRAGRSIQETARAERYRFLEETAHRTGAAWIAVGHTATDQAETLLLRLLRGTGPVGLAGIPLVRDGRIVRPLLRVTRDTVLEYLTRHELAYRRDRSNDDPHYTRNRLRADLLPRLARDYNPAIVPALANTAMLMAEEGRLMEELLAAIWREGLIGAAPDRLIFDRDTWLRQPPAVQRWWLHRALRVLSAGAAGGARGIQELLGRLRHACRQAGDGASGRVRLRGGVAVEFDQTQIRFERRLAERMDAPAANRRGG